MIFTIYLIIIAIAPLVVTNAVSDLSHRSTPRWHPRNFRHARPVEKLSRGNAAPLPAPIEVPNRSISYQELTQGVAKWSGWQADDFESDIQKMSTANEYLSTKIAPSTFLGRTYPWITGGSCATVFEVSEPKGQKVRFNATPVEEKFTKTPGPDLRPPRAVNSIVKFSCSAGLPYRKEDVCVNCLSSNPNKLTSIPVQNKMQQLALAIQRIVDDCGLHDVHARAWAGHVKTKLPDGSDYEVVMPALFNERAPGIAVRPLVDASFSKERSKHLLQIWKTLDSREIYRMALFDLLLGHCDRHTEQIFIDDGGATNISKLKSHLTSIDSDNILTDSSCHMSTHLVDSLVLPGTRYWYESRYDPGFVRSYFANTGRPVKERVSPAYYFDYRCHVPDGKIGFHYPKAFKQCIKDISNYSTDEILDRYGMKGIYSDSSGKNSDKDIKAAEYLRLRASLLLYNGFEDALLNLTSRNINSAGIKKFDQHLDFRSPCCDIGWQEGKYVCMNGGDSVISGYWKDI